MNENVENSMMVEYFIVAAAAFAYGVFSLVIPVGLNSPLWSKWLTFCVSALCGWFLWQRKSGEKMILPLTTCWVVFIAGLAALLYIPDSQTILEFLKIISPITNDTTDSVRSMQHVFSCAWVGALGCYLSIFSHFGRIKGRKTTIPLICGALAIAGMLCCAYIPALDTRITVTPSLILVSFGFLRMFALERYEHL